MEVNVGNKVRAFRGEGDRSVPQRRREQRRF